MERLALLVKHIWLTKKWAYIQKLVKIEKLAHFQSELIFLVKRSPGPISKSKAVVSITGADLVYSA